MKQAFAGIAIFGVIIFTLLTIFDLEITLTSKKENRQGLPVHPSENKPEQIIDHISPAEDVATLSPACNATALTVPPAKDDNTPIIASEHLTTPDNEPALLDPKDKLPPKPEEENIIQQAAVQPTLPANDNPSQGLGLLTDTGETEENRLFEPQATQVQPALPKKAYKKAAGPTIETMIKEVEGMQLAIVPEGSYPFSILLETFDEQSNAKQAVALYRKRGLATFWVKVDLGSSSGVKYRLFTGMFSSEAAAQNFRTHFRLNAQFVKKAPHAARIGIFQDKKELTMAFAHTSETGSFPYILGTESGPFFLYVGAFYTADGAENQCRELVSKGLPCKAVLRTTLPPKN